MEKGGDGPERGMEVLEEGPGRHGAQGVGQIALNWSTDTPRSRGPCPGPGVSLGWGGDWTARQAPSSLVLSGEGLGEGRAGSLPHGSALATPVHQTDLSLPALLL